MTNDKQPAAVWRDLFDPGWREREAEHARKFLAAVPLRSDDPRRPSFDAQFNTVVGPPAEVLAAAQSLRYYFRDVAPDARMSEDDVRTLVDHILGGKS